jgi:type 1 glutamine amidotransferase
LYDTYIRTDSAIVAREPLKTDGTPASGGPSLESVDAIFFMGHREIDLTATQKADLIRFVRDEGKGFVGAHVATTAFASWPEFGEMIGARYDDHPWNVVKAGVIVEDPSFPAMKHFPATFKMTDEMYQHKDFSRDKLRVLMRLDPSTLDLTNKNVRRKDLDFPEAWAKMYGKGRVFYSALGHARRPGTIHKSRRCTLKRSSRHWG